MSDFKISLIKIILVFTIINYLTASPIVTDLWSKELFGQVHSLNYVNDKQILVSSKRGVISKVNLRDGEIAWKKNLFYKSQIDVVNSLLVNKDINQMDLINNENSNLIWSNSFTHNKQDKLLKFELVNEQKNLVGVLIESRNVKIFNKDKILSDIIAKENQEFLDYFIDSEKEILHFVTIVDNKSMEINEMNLHKTAAKTTKKIATFVLHNDSGILNVFLTKSFCTVIFNSGDYLIYNKKHSDNVLKGKFNFEFENIQMEKLNFVNVIFFKSENSLHFLRLENNKLTTNNQKELNNIKLYNKIDSNKNTTIYFLEKKNLNSYQIYNIDFAVEAEYKLNFVSKHSINENINIINFYANPYKLNNFLITTKEDKLIFLEKEQVTPSNIIDQSISDVDFIELVAYYNEQGKQNQKIHYHNSLDNLLHLKDISVIFLNIIKGIQNDLTEIGLRLKNNFNNLLENPNNSETNLNQKIKHYLIIFTKMSEELIILNAADGSIVSQRQYKNESVIKVIRNTNEDMNKNENKFIFIVMKDKNSEHSHSLKFNLETAELFEDISLINDLLIEQEIKNKCDSIVSNLDNSPLTLTKTLSNSELEKYDNKYSIEVKNNNIYGIKYTKTENNKLELGVAWNMVMNENSIIQEQTPNIHPNLITTYQVQGKVFYKYIDANIILLLSNIKDKTLMVTLLKANSGKILHQSQVQNVDFTQKIYSVFEENLAVISYMKKERTVTRNELYTIEIMKREIEHSFVNLVEKILRVNLFGDSDNKLVEDDTLQENDLVFLTQTYVLTRRIKGLFTSKTKLNVANKFLIFLFENNQVFLLDKRMISPRRPLMREEKGKPPVFDPLNSPYVDPELTPYSPLLALDYKFMLNPLFSEDQIDKVLVVPTEYESTFLVCSQGLNFSCYNVFPDKTFDTLNKSFPYPIIALFVIGIITLTYFLRRYVKKNEFNKTFINSN